MSVTERGLEVEARDVAFRPMSMFDLPAVLRNETLAYPYPWSQGVFRDCLKARHECWVVELDERVIGHGILSAAVEEAHLLNVCISRDYQGWGLGRRLVLPMLEIARQRNSRTLFLEVRPSNVAATTLYRSLGFRGIGKRRDYYPAPAGREDALVMSLDLESPLD